MRSGTSRSTPRNPTSTGSAEAAEANLVAWAEERLRNQFPDRFDAIKGAFEAYREHLLFGDMRARFIDLCFNCPIK